MAPTVAVSPSTSCILRLLTPTSWPHLTCPPLAAFEWPVTFRRSGWGSKAENWPKIGRRSHPPLLRGPPAPWGTPAVVRGNLLAGARCDYSKGLRRRSQSRQRGGDDATLASLVVEGSTLLVPKLSGQRQNGVATLRQLALSVCSSGTSEEKGYTNSYLLGCHLRYCGSVGSSTSGVGHPIRFGKTLASVRVAAGVAAIGDLRPDIH